MKKLLIFVFAWLAMIFYSGSVFAGPAVKKSQKTNFSVEESLKTNFSDLKFDSVVPSPVAGLYEVTVGQAIYYYAPKEGILIAGNMFNKDKKNLTADKMQKLRDKFDQEIALKAKDLPLDKAVKLGAGKNIVIEFTDPDCPYCRRAAQFFEKRDDLTKYTFFMPLAMHPDAPNKVRYILCQQDKGKAFEEVMKGNIDNKKYETCTNAEVDDLMKLHKSIAEKMGVQSTPFFIINGAVVNGADIPRIEQLLGKKSAEVK